MESISQIHGACHGTSASENQFLLPENIAHDEACSKTTSSELAPSQPPDSLWHLSQPIVFARPVQQSTDDKRWNPSIPIVFATEDQGHSRSFSTRNALLAAKKPFKSNAFSMPRSPSAAHTALRFGPGPPILKAAGHTASAPLPTIRPDWVSSSSLGIPTHRARFPPAQALWQKPAPADIAFKIQQAADDLEEEEKQGAAWSEVQRKRDVRARKKAGKAKMEPRWREEAETQRQQSLHSLNCQEALELGGTPYVKAHDKRRAIALEAAAPSLRVQLQECLDECRAETTTAEAPWDIKTIQMGTELQPAVKTRKSTLRARRARKRSLSLIGNRTSSSLSSESAETTQMGKIPQLGEKGKNVENVQSGETAPSGEVAPCGGDIGKKPSSSGNRTFSPTQPKLAPRSCWSTSNLTDVGMHETSGSIADEAASPADDEASDPVSQEEVYVPLSYQIPVDTMKAAMHASPSTPAAYWSHKLYRGPSDGKIAVHYCRSKDTGETVAQLFLGKPVLGFDIEWKPQAKAESGLKNNISLVQLACEDRVALFHLALHKGETAEEILPPTLRTILGSANVMKVGVAILADFSRVSKFLDIAPAGLIELSHLHKLVTYSECCPQKVNKALVGLAAQVQIHLRLPLFKGDVRTSDWSKQLNHEQCSYAAADAYASYRVYEALEEKRIAMNPRPPRPAFAELKMPIKLADRVVVSDLSLDEESVEEIPSTDEAELLRGELEKFSLGLSSGADENSSAKSMDSDNQDLTNDELRTLQLASADESEVEDLTNQDPLVGPRSYPSRLNVKHADLPAFEEDDKSSKLPPAVFVGRVRFGDASTSSAVGDSTLDQQADIIQPPGLQMTKEEMLDSATTWAKTHAALKSQNPTPIPLHPWAESKANLAALRCYYLWEHCDLEINQIVKMVRDPPLKKATVAAYVAEAVAFENLGYKDIEKLKRVLEDLSYLARGRYTGLAREVFGEKGR